MISCIICHHKGTLVYGAVRSILKSRDCKFEIIIVTSDPELKEVAGARVIFEKGGPAHKRNIGVKFALGYTIAFFDDDIEVTPYAIAKMEKELSSHRVGMVFGKLLNMEHRDTFDEAGSFLTSSGFLWARAESGCKDIGQFQKVEPILAGKSASCMIKRSLFWKIGGFDASYEILAEETDLAWRVWLSGHQVLFVPSSVTYHAFNTKFKPADFYIPKRVYFNGCRNYITMLLTNLGNGEVAVPVILQVIVWSMAGIGMIVTGKTEAGAYIFRGLWYVVRNLRGILRKRWHVQSHRVISDAELMPIIKRNPPIMYYIKRFFHYIKTGRHG